MLSLAEIGKRELPTPALLKLTELHQIFVQNDVLENLPLIDSELAIENSKLNNFLQENEAETLQQILQLQKQLTTVKLNYNNALRLLNAIKTMQNKLPNTQANKKDLLWLAAMEASIKTVIRKNGLVKQKQLELKIQNLT